MPVSAGEKKRVNILVVDDKPANICSVLAILSDPAYNLVTANSGMEALKYILQSDFAVILLDVMMPEMDGFELARLVRQRSRSSVIPIIFLTALATDFRFMQEGYAVGAVDYLQKPLDPDMVRAKVAVFVELYRRSEMIKEQEALLRELQRNEQERKLDTLKQESERHFRGLAEALPQIIITADGGGSIRYLNPRWTQLTGSEKPESLFDDSFMALVHPHDQEMLKQAWQKACLSQETLETELRLKDQQQLSFRWHLCQVQPELANDKELLGWIATLTDIDLQKRREEGQRLLADASVSLAANLDMRQSIAQICERILENFADIAICDLIEPSKTFRRLYRSNGLTPEFDEVLRAVDDFKLAKTFGALALADAQARLISPLKNRASEFAEEFQAALSLGSKQPSSLISVPILARGEVVGALTLLKCTAFDKFTHIELNQLVEIGRHISLSLENLMLYEEVRDNNRLKDEFLAILSHELRTPLNSILGWTELVKLEAVEPRVIEGLTVVERSAHTLTQLVNDLLDVSRIISGKLEVSKQVVDIQMFLKNVVAALQPLADSKQVNLQLEVNGQLPKIDADPSRLEQIIWNLINNAIKFTPKDGQVKITARSTSDRKIEIIVSDTGIGIRPELLPHVFERFRQADSSSTRRHGGLGLGLAIVKHLAALHDGTVTASSKGVGLGSTFAVSLPSSYASAPTLPGLEGARTENLENALNNLRILLVDDDPSTRMLTARQLMMSGARVDAAGSVREAMTIVRDHVPDVVLTDIGMPEQDGFTLLRLLRHLELQIGQSIRVAAFSAYASDEDARHALEKGFDTYLTKPISVSNLINAVLKLKNIERPYFHGQHGSVLGDSP